MKLKTRKILGIIAATTVIVIGCVIIFGKKTIDFHDKYEGADLMTDVVGLERKGTYSGYLTLHQDAGYPEQNVTIDITDVHNTKGVELLTSYEGESNVLYTDEKSEVSFTIHVPESGFYQIYMEYLAPESRGVSVERSIYINGELPFEEAKNICFSRVWKDKTEKRIDNQGNEIRPTQVEEFLWQSSYIRDSLGYIITPFCFYFEEGSNEISLHAVNEPLAIKKIELKEVKNTDSYADYYAKAPQIHADTIGREYIQIVQGEDSTYRSEPSLYARYDRASSTTKPYSISKTILNYIGGDAWRTSGQWIEWNFNVPEDGFYHITIKGRQNYARGNVSSRSILIDGQIPFDELKAVSFHYSNDWDTMTLCDQEGTPYRIYLTKGDHQLRMEATLGGVGDILQRMEDCTYRLNQIYRTLLVYMGANPDKYRDYHIEQVYPNMLEAMDLESKRMYKIVDDMVAYSGQKADQIAAAQTLAQQLERFVDKPEKIPAEYTNFRDNITALGAAILSLSETKLDVDYLVVSGEDAKVDYDKANIFDKAWHEISSFAASFYVDYDAVGDVYDEKDDEVITVWVLSGRDQGTILKSMVDDTFTPEHGIKINVEIVAQDALLSAVVAGRGPDVVLTVGADQPVNYALRNAVEDLTQFDDLTEVLKPYTESSYEQYRFEDGIYGIPETQSFNVMFYREDILNELGLSVPQTWKELIEMLPTIQGNNMSIGIPSAAGTSTGLANTAIASSTPDLTLFISMLYQYGGTLYSDDDTRTTINEEAGVQAFDDYTRFFTDYGIPKIYDFVSRFRSGEMPIGIASYPTYNTLTVSAPEIRGLWKFTMIPGIEKTDASGNTYIDRANVIAGSASMMIKQNDETQKQNAWEFLKWWSSTDTQVRFGREIESLLGSSARYATANKEAFAQLSWSAEDIEALSKQWDQTTGIPEIPGGYYLGRHIANAVRKVINEKTDPRETIIDYSIAIDDEIKKKRTEFGLPME